MQTVPFGDNFDASETEPLVLPAKLPMLLINGAVGIAVGMATSIPPHNPTELLDATVALLNDETLGDEALLGIVRAPDFPTGGELLGLDGVKALYSTGQGVMQLRGKVRTEQLGRGRGGGAADGGAERGGGVGSAGAGAARGGTPRHALVVSELPYAVTKNAFITKVADLVQAGRLAGVAEIRDESDRDGMRVVLELKRDANPAVVTNHVLKATPLQSSFAGNLLALTQDGRQPARVSLRTALLEFVTFRKLTTRRRAQFEKDRARSRLHVTVGLTAALRDIDTVVGILRGAKTLEAAREALTGPDPPLAPLPSARLLTEATANVRRAAATPAAAPPPPGAGAPVASAAPAASGAAAPAPSGAAAELSAAVGSLSVVQADAILAMPLRRLTGLEAEALEQECQALAASIDRLNTLLTDDAVLVQTLVDEAAAMRAAFGCERRTRINEADGSAILTDAGARAAPRSAAQPRGPMAPGRARTARARAPRAARHAARPRRALTACAPATPRPATISTTPCVGAARRTRADLISNERCAVLMTARGYVKRMLLEDFGAQRRGTRGKAAVASGAMRDAVVAFFGCHQHDIILCITERGVAHSRRAYELPKASRTAQGTPVHQLLPIPPSEKVQGFLAIPAADLSPPTAAAAAAAIAAEQEEEAEEEEAAEEESGGAEVAGADDELGPPTHGGPGSLLLITRHGFIKKTPLAAFASITARGLTAINLGEGDSLLRALHCPAEIGAEASVILASAHGMAMRFSLADSVLRPTGRTSRGVRAMALREGDELVDADILVTDVTGVTAGGEAGGGEAGGAEGGAEPLSVLAVTANGFGKRVAASAFRPQNRGGRGRIAIKFKPAGRAAGSGDDRLVALRACTPQDEVLLSTLKGTAVRQAVGEISEQSRTATGVLLQRLDAGDRVANAAVLPRDSGEADGEVGGDEDAAEGTDDASADDDDA